MADIRDWTKDDADAQLGKAQMELEEAVRQHENAMRLLNQTAELVIFKRGFLAGCRETLVPVPAQEKKESE